MAAADTQAGIVARDAVGITTVALLLRFALVVWAAPRFPPAGDGQYYHVVAGRIARGLGYTWLWPDGAVTFAAHYPIGYPGILGVLYATLGESTLWPMLLNACAGASIVWSVHCIASRFAKRQAAAFAAGAAALHPTLLFYTPALMTELVSAALCIGVAALAVGQPRSRWGFWMRVMTMGAISGIGTLVRPQQLLFAPFFGFLFAILAENAWFLPANQRARGPFRKALLAAAVVTAISVGVCLPWTFRNCSRMGQCVFVSANAGWNLLIGASPKGEGAWTSVDSVGVPAACRLVFAEARKDTCFGAAALSIIGQHPIAWFGLVPAKLKKTFDDVGAPGWYLNTADWHYFDDRAKAALAVTEVLAQRVSMMIALVGLMRVRGKGRALRIAIAAAAMGCLFYTYAWIAVLLLCLGILLIGRRLLAEPLLLFLAFAYGTTALVHAVFFGGARYAIVVMPFMLASMARAWPAGVVVSSVVGGSRVGGP
jgi:hypothetical protein